MKRIYILVSTILLSLGAFAQAPQKMSYQAVIRDVQQNIVVNNPVGMKISVLQGSANGTEVYVESHNSTTNSNGLTSLEIGMGNVINGDFSTIDWANGPYFIKTETTIKGGSNLTITGTSQMLSVPFALYAANSGNSTPGPQGPIGFTGLTGPAGASGNSAYDVWLAAGNTGTQADFFASLQGAAGPQGPIGFTGLTGPAGASGNSAYDVWLAAGNTGTQADFFASLQGASGPQGPIGFTGLTGPAGAPGVNGIDGAAGPEGESAYDIWLKEGNTGSTADFLASLQGTNGNDGAAGPIGATGVEGESAYDMWLNAGNTGSTADFLASLQGPAGSYIAGSGIDISGGVISTIAPSSPEFIFLQPDDLGGGFVGFGITTVVNGILYNYSTDEFTLKAGKTYMLDGAVYLKDTESGGTYSFVFYDKTNDTPIGSESLQTSSDFAGIVINQPLMSGIITPATDIQVAVRDISGLTGVVNSSRGFFKITELK